MPIHLKIVKNKVNQSKRYYSIFDVKILLFRWVNGEWYLSQTQRLDWIHIGVTIKKNSLPRQRKKMERKKKKNPNCMPPLTGNLS